MTFRTGDTIVLEHDRRDVPCLSIAHGQTLVATGSQDGNVYLWDMSSGSRIMTLAKAHKGDVTGVSFNSDASVLASCGDDGNLVLWDLRNMSTRVRHRYLESHGACIGLTALVFCPSSALLATCGKDHDVMLWGSGGQPVCRRLRGHSNWVTCAAFSADSASLVTGGFDTIVCFWDCVTFTIVRRIRRHDQPVTAVALSSEASVVASGDETGLVLLTKSDGSVLRRLSGHAERISSVCFIDRFGLVLSTGHDTSVKVWSLRGRCVKSFRAHDGCVLSMAVNHEQDTIVTTGDDFTARVVPFLWDDAEELRDGFKIPSKTAVAAGEDTN
jgi:hypothetical protein